MKLSNFEYYLNFLGILFKMNVSFLPLRESIVIKMYYHSAHESVSKLQKLRECHSERSEESSTADTSGFLTSFEMTEIKSFDTVSQAGIQVQSGFMDSQQVGNCL